MAIVYFAPARTPAYPKSWRVLGLFSLAPSDGERARVRGPGYCSFRARQNTSIPRFLARCYAPSSCGLCTSAGDCFGLSEFCVVNTVLAASASGPILRRASVMECAQPSAALDSQPKP